MLCALFDVLCANNNNNYINVITGKRISFTLFDCGVTVLSIFEYLKAIAWLCHTLKRQCIMHNMVHILREQRRNKRCTHFVYYFLMCKNMRNNYGQKENQKIMNYYLFYLIAIRP